MWLLVDNNIYNIYFIVFVLKWLGEGSGYCVVDKVDFRLVRNNCCEKGSVDVNLRGYFKEGKKRWILLWKYII